MATQSSVSVTASGASPIATVTQTQGGSTVYIQQVATVDPTSGVGAGVTNNGALQVVETKGTTKTSGALSQAGVIAGASGTFTIGAVTVGRTGTLQHGTFSATLETRWQIVTVNNSGAITTVAQFLTGPNQTFDFKPGSVSEISTVLSTGSTVKFEVSYFSLNQNANVTSTVYASVYWVEN